MLIQPKEAKYTVGKEIGAFPHDAVEALASGTIPRSLAAAVREASLLVFRSGTSPIVQQSSAGTWLSPLNPTVPDWHRDIPDTPSALALIMPDVKQNAAGRSADTCFLTLKAVREAWNDALESAGIRSVLETPDVLDIWHPFVRAMADKTRPTTKDVMDFVNACEMRHTEEGPQRPFLSRLVARYRQLFDERSVRVRWDTPGQMILWDDTAGIHSGIPQQPGDAGRTLKPKKSAFLLRRMFTLPRVRRIRPDSSSASSS